MTAAELRAAADRAYAARDRIGDSTPTDDPAIARVSGRLHRQLSSSTTAPTSPRPVKPKRPVRGRHRKT